MKEKEERKRIYREDGRERSLPLTTFFPKLFVQKRNREGRKEKKGRGRGFQSE